MHPDPISADDYDRLARYIAGEGSEVERTDTERWVNGDPVRRAALEAMKVAWATPLAEPVWHVDQAWGKLSSRIAAEAPTAKPELRKHSKVATIESRRRWWQDTAVVMRVAAAAVLLIGGALILPKLRSSAGDAPQLATAAPTSFETGSGERRTVTLADGSVVVLGVSSSLVTRDGFGNGAREVELTGEALFTVVHDANRPFRVIVGGTVVEDLGTEFAVRGYGDAPGVRVAVASGSVAIRRGLGPDTAVVLAPRDVATVGDSGVVAVQRGIDVSPFTAFASGRLIFVDTPLSEVAAELTRWYGVEVRITDASLVDKHLTVTFERESLDEVLRIIGMSLDVRYVRDGNRVEFTGQGYTSSRPTPDARVLAEAGA